jgi:hypothetical protein
MWNIRIHNFTLQDCTGRLPLPWKVANFDDPKLRSIILGRSGTDSSASGRLGTLENCCQEEHRGGEKQLWMP